MIEGFAGPIVADMLGLSRGGRSTATSTVAFMDAIDSGLPVRALDRVAGLLAPADLQFKYRFVPRATYDRRKAAHRLSPDEGLKIARVARVWALARDVWGTDEDARDFLFRRHAMLEDNAPIDVALRNEIGGELVMDILARLKYGSAA